MSANYEDILRALSQASVARRKCFVSYFRADTTKVDTFVSNFKDVFIPRVIGVTDGDDFIDSDDSDYVMSKIREKYWGIRQ